MWAFLIQRNSCSRSGVTSVERMGPRSCWTLVLGTLRVFLPLGLRRHCEEHRVGTWEMWTLFPHLPQIARVTLGKSHLPQLEKPLEDLACGDR